MNLHSIASQYVTAVNPNITVSIRKSTGYTTGADGRRVATFDDPVLVQAQMQSLQYNDIVQLDGLNIQGERRALYLAGDWDGIQRADGRGGDLITFPDGSVWLVAIVLENWSFQDGWVKVCVTRQTS